ncbi:hypothetical protein ACH5RR_006870 [Cinchona calisaya]|uniref:Uncharacterized protein n=1 Tax=Cinchona calisaya TaxID=153742 RepID=A0ABD3AQB1_9GENT
METSLTHSFAPPSHQCFSNGTICQVGSHNKITPPSSSSDSYDEGSIVDLSHNMQSGELPAVAFREVETLFLNNNLFTGKVPKEFIENLYNGGSETLYLQQNYLTDFPVLSDMKLPDSVFLCLSYNCLVTNRGAKSVPG